MGRVQRTGFSTAILLTAGLCVAQPAVPPPAPSPSKGAPELAPAPRIVFERVDHDYGTILDTKMHRTTFRFTNKGKDTLQFLGAKSTCGCTVPELEKTEYAPGESGELLVIFDPSNRKGPQARAITVTTNDPIQKNVILRINADVTPLVDVEPANVDFGEVKPGETRSFMVDIVGRGPGFKVEDPMLSNGEGLSIEMLPMQEGSDDLGEFRRVSMLVSLSENAPMGRILSRITARIVDSEGNAVIKTIPVTGEVVGDIRVVPNRVNLGILDPGQEFERQFRLISRSNQPFVVKKIEEKPLEDAEGKPLPEQMPGLSFTVQPMAEGRTDSWVITIKGAVPGDLRRLYTRLVVHTDRKDEQRIPLFATARIREVWQPESVPERPALPRPEAGDETGEQ